jgi:type II secretory pathway pseudopilin PulG
MGMFSTERRHSAQEEGMGMVEAVVVIAIASVAFASILASAVFFLRGGLMNADRVQAAYLLEEGIEAMRFLRDQGYAANIVPLIGTTFYLETTPTGYAATTTNDVVLGAFTRTFTIEEVYRRTADDRIVPAISGDPKTLDPGTVELTVTVTWPRGAPISVTTYVSDHYEN